MELKHLKAIAAVGEELHFTRAAQKLHCSNATLTVRISELEDELGVQLLKRNTRHVELTKAGAEFRRHALTIMSQVSAAVRTARKVAITNRFRIGGIDAALVDVLPDGHLRLEERSLEIETETMSADAAIFKLMESRVDLAIVYQQPSMLELDSICVRHEALVVAVAAASTLASRSEISPAHIAKETIILPDQHLDEHLFQLAQSYLFARGIQEENVKTKSNWQTSIAYVAAGRAVAFIPIWMTRFLPADVKARPLADAPPEYEVNLVWRNDVPNPIAGTVARRIAAHSEQLVKKSKTKLPNNRPANWT